MKDEIKEILSLLKSSSWCNEAEQIEDYITNLQEKYKDLLEVHKIENNDIQDLLERIDKAIEYIKENEFYLDYKAGACIKGVIPLLNILQGDDKE